MRKTTPDGYTKEQVLSEVLTGINQMKILKQNSLSCDDISPWGNDEVSDYVTKNLDRMGYKLYAYHYTSDDKPTGEPSGLKITWE